MIIIAASMHIREHRSLSLRTPSIHMREEDPKEVVKSSICGIMMGILFMSIFSIISFIGVFTNLEDMQHSWMLIILCFTYTIFIPYFVMIISDLRTISAELELHQDESIAMNQNAFMSGMNIIVAITSNEKYNPFKLINIQFFLVSLILSAFLLNSRIVIGSLLAIVNYIIAGTIVIYCFRKCWLSCCNIRIFTKRPKRYQYQRYSNTNQVKIQASYFACFLSIYYILKGILYVLFLCFDNSDLYFTMLASLLYSVIMCLQMCYILYLIKRIRNGHYRKKYFKCYATLFQALYLSYTSPNMILKGLYVVSLAASYIAFFLEKPYMTITQENLIGIQQYCSYEYFLYMFTFCQLVYFCLFRSYCVTKEEEQIQVFDFNQIQPQLWMPHYNDQPIYCQQSASQLLYQISDLEALLQVYDNILLKNNQLDFKLSQRTGRLVGLQQWIEGKKYQFQLQGKQVDENYFINLRAFIEQSTSHQKIEKLDRTECAICLQNLEPQQAITQLECHSTHKFHTECIEKWIQIVHKCPLCNQPA